jgi:hypothetical protein
MGSYRICATVIRTHCLRILATHYKFIRTLNFAGNSHWAKEIGALGARASFGLWSDVSYSGRRTGFSSYQYNWL